MATNIAGQPVMVPTTSMTQVASFEIAPFVNRPYQPIHLRCEGPGTILDFMIALSATTDDSCPSKPYLSSADFIATNGNLANANTNFASPAIVPGNPVVLVNSDEFFVFQHQYASKVTLSVLVSQPGTIVKVWARSG